MCACLSICLWFFLCFFFFFKQKTAYEMRISDWSSDVCSSDLAVSHEQQLGGTGWRLEAVLTIGAGFGHADQSMDSSGVRRSAGGVRMDGRRRKDRKSVV